MTKLDWETASRRQRASNPEWDKPRPSRRKQAMVRFVAEHSLDCFKCHKYASNPAKVGRNKRGPWAICKGCVNNG